MWRASALELLRVRPRLPMAPKARTARTARTGGEPAVVLRRSTRLQAVVSDGLADVSGRRALSSVALPVEPTAAKRARRSGPQATGEHAALAGKSEGGGNTTRNVKSEGGEGEERAAAAARFPHGTLPRTFEAAKVTKGYKFVVGVDEAGRGPLAGPVVAAACHVPLDVMVDGVHDSKKLNEAQREMLYEQLTTHPRIQWAVHVNSAQRIDEINILQASLESMVKAAEALAETPDFVFVDGNRMPPTITCDAETVVKGDSKVYSIAAASVIAKVTRDRLMLAYDAQFPQYNLKQHKGYPTRDHMAAIAKHGPCEIHRMTFAPLKPKEPKKPKSVTKKQQTTTKGA